MAYMAMELLEGQDLRELLAKGKPRALEDKLAMMEQILDGLAFAHSKGVMHRDLKPGNVHVLPNGQIKIMDFGLARRAAGRGGERRRDGDAVLHGARAGAGRARHRALRHLLARRDVLRDARGPAAVHRRDDPGRAVLRGAPRPGAARQAGARPRDRDRRDGDARARQGPAGPPRRRRRDAAARCAWRGRAARWRRRKPPSRPTTRRRRATLGRAALGARGDEPRAARGARARSSSTSPTACRR